MADKRSRVSFRNGVKGGKIHQPENEGGQLYSTNQKMRGGQLLTCTIRYIHNISPPVVFPFFCSRCFEVWRLFECSVYSRAAFINLSTFMLIVN